MQIHDGSVFIVKQIVLLRKSIITTSNTMWLFESEVLMRNIALYHFSTLLHP